MAKKTSAASKGYRKTVKKKPFLTKKEIIELIVIVAVIVLAVVLFNVLYNPYIAAKDVQADDIIANAIAKSSDKFVRLGTVTDLDGYTRESTVSVDTPTGYNTYTPVDENDPMDHFTVSGSVSNAATTLSYMMSYYQPYADTVGEVIETEVEGHTAYICHYTLSEYREENDPDAAAEEAAPAEETEDSAVAEDAAETEPAEVSEPVEDAAETEGAEETAAEGEEAASEPEPNTFYQYINMYIDADDSHSIGVNAYRQGSDDSFYLADDEIEAYMLNLAQVITFPEK